MRTQNVLAVVALLAGCESQAPAPKADPPPPGPPQVTVAGAAFSRDGKLLLTAYRIEHPGPHRAMPKRLALWEVATGKKLWAANATETLRPVGFLPGDKAVLVQGETSLQVWDASKGERLRSFAPAPERSMISTAMSADGAVALTNVWAEGLKLWDVGSGKLVRAIGRSKPSRSAALSRDGKRALSLGSSSLKSPSASLNVWDPATGELIHRFDKSGRWGWPVVFSPDGTLAATGHSEVIRPKGEGKDKRARLRNELILWKVATGEEIGRLPGGANAVAFTPDGKRLAVVNSEGLKVWEVASGREVWSQREGATDQFGFTLSPNGKVAFSASGSYMVGAGRVIKLRLWDMTNGKLLRTLEDRPWASGT
jgi:WD40 repeat protein